MNVKRRISADIRHRVIWALSKSRYLSHVASKYHGKHPKHLIDYEAWFMRYIKEHDVVLDVGCDYHLGHAKKCAEVCRFVSAFDIKKPKSDNTSSTNTINIHAIKHDATKLFPYESARFDKVLLLDVLEHLSSTATCLDEIRRVMTDDALLIISLPNPNTSWKAAKAKANVNPSADSDHKRELSPKAISSLLKRHGFHATDFIPLTTDTPLVGFIDLSSILSLRLYKYLTLRRIRNATPQNTSGFGIIAEKEMKK